MAGTGAAMAQKQRLLMKGLCELSADAYDFLSIRHFKLVSMQMEIRCRVANNSSVKALGLTSNEFIS